MKPLRAAFIHSDELEKYHYPAGCPFITERANRTKSILLSMDYYTGEGRIEVKPEPATEDELKKFHTEDYLNALERVSSGAFNSKDLFMGLGTDDTPIFPDLYNYSILASGGSITGAKLILNDKADIVFNPSGGYHHANADKAGGFCYINDVVLACMMFIEAGKKVLCLDLDAHHGDGTQAAFYNTNQVFTISFHESGKTLYPWGGFEYEIGEKKGKGFNLNLSFPAETDDDIYIDAFEILIPPLINSYNPDVIVLEIGMDILSVDPLTHLKMTNNAVANIIPQVTAFDKPILVVGGGGYSLEDTARGWARCWTVLCDLTLQEEQHIGLGGVFLGSTEWNAGLKDKHIYLQGEEKVRVKLEVNKKLYYLIKNLFPYHNL